MGHPACTRFVTIPRHGEEEEAEVEGETGGGASRDGDADAHDVAQVEVLRHEGVEDEALDEEGDGDDVEDEEEENGLPILLQEVGEGVPLLDQRRALLLVDRLHAEALHARDVGGAVEEVPLGALAVEPDGEEVALELLHHRLEVVVAQRLLVVEASRPR